MSSVRILFMHRKISQNITRYPSVTFTETFPTDLACCCPLRRRVRYCSCFPLLLLHLLVRLFVYLFLVAVYDRQLPCWGSLWSRTRRSLVKFATPRDSELSSSQAVRQANRQFPRQTKVIKMIRRRDRANRSEGQVGAGVTCDLLT